MPAAVRTAVNVVATTGAASWRRRGVVTISGLVGAGLGLVAAGQLTPTYVGTASVLVGPPPGASTSAGQRLAATPEQVADAAAVMASPTVRADAAKLAGARVVPPARTKVQRGSDVVQVTVETHTAATAARFALAYADAYVAREQVTSIDGLQAAAATAAGQVTDLIGQIAALNARIAAAGGPTTPPSTVASPVTLYPGLPQYTLPTQATLVPVATVPLPLASTGNGTVDALLAQRTALQAREAVLSQQVTQLGAEAAAFSGGGQVTAGGSPPGSPVSPNTTAWAVGAGVVGLLVAAAAVTTLEWRQRGPVAPRWVRGGAGRAAERRLRPHTDGPQALGAPTRLDASSPGQEHTPVGAPTAAAGSATPTGVAARTAAAAAPTAAAAAATVGEPAGRGTTIVLRPRPVVAGSMPDRSAGLLRFAPRAAPAATAVRRADSARRELPRAPTTAPAADAGTGTAAAPTPIPPPAGRTTPRRRNSVGRRRQSLRARPTTRGNR